MVVAGAILLLVVALLLLIYLCAEVKAERRARIAKQEASKNGEPNSSAALDAATLFGIAATHEYLRRTSDSEDDSWNDSSSPRSRTPPPLLRIMGISSEEAWTIDIES